MILQVADWECLADSGGLGPDWSLVSLVYPYVKPLALFLIPVKKHPYWLWKRFLLLYLYWLTYILGWVVNWHFAFHLKPCSLLEARQNYHAQMAAVAHAAQRSAYQDALLSFLDDLASSKTSFNGL